jgi:Ca2+-binding EF-hand superfamily protein
VEHLRTAAHVWAEYLDQEQKVEDIFTAFDEDHNGSLDLRELRKFVASYLTSCPPKILQSITRKHNGGINVSPSQTKMKTQVTPTQEQVELYVQAILTECDDLGNSVIEKPEMVKALVSVYT